MATQLPRALDEYLDATRRGWTTLMQAVVEGNEVAVAELLAAGAEVDAIAEGADCALSLACDAGAEDVVAQLLAAGADSCARSRQDRSPLHLAARHGSTSLIRRLVDAGARLANDAGGHSPLSVAIRFRHPAVLEMLWGLPLPPTEPNDAFGFACEHGDVTALRLLWDRFGSSLLGSSNAGDAPPLARAARGGDPAAIHFLIDAGAEIDAFDLKEDISPLMHAVSAGRYEAARALLERGAHASAQTEWFVTAMSIAERRADQPMIELLRSHGAVSTKVPMIHISMPWAVYSNVPRRAPAESALHAAAAADDVAALDRLVDTSDPRDLHGALDAAADAGAADAVALLLACGADPHAGDPSPLARAIRAGHARAVRLMLAAAPGRPLDATVTLQAAMQSDPWVLAAVLDHGAPADEAVGHRRPLFVAAGEGRWRHVELLCDRGARLDGVDATGASPLATAAGRGHVRCVEVLADRDLAPGRAARIDAALLRAAEHPRVIEALLRRGADPDARDRAGDSLLHVAAGNPRASIDLPLSVARRHLATRGRLGWTPLHNAAISGSARTVRVLVAAGADLEARDDDARTPLLVACTYNGAVLPALLAAGAKVGVQDAGGDTPLHHAVRVGPEPVAFLLAAGADPGARDARGRTALEMGEAELQICDYRTRADRRSALALLRRSIVD